MGIKVANWSSYQSYKDRKPPWIRLHRGLIDNYAFQMMTADSRAILPMLWLLACEDKDPTSGVIPYDCEQIAFRLRISNEMVTKSLREISEAGFIEVRESQVPDVPPCNESVTEPVIPSNSTVTPETETETETETEAEKRQRRSKKPVEISFPDSLDTDPFKEVWAKWVSYRAEIKKKMTKATMEGQIKKFEKLGADVSIKMMENSISNGWVGLFDLKDDNNGADRRPGAIGFGGVQQGEDSGGKFDHIGTTIHVPDVRDDSMQDGQGLPENSGDRF